MASGFGGFTGACVDGTRVSTGAGVVGISNIVGCGGNDGSIVDVLVGGADTVTGAFVGARVARCPHPVRKHHNAPIIRRIVAKSLIVPRLIYSLQRITLSKHCCGREILQRNTHDSI